MTDDQAPAAIGSDREATLGPRAQRRVRKTQRYLDVALGLIVGEGLESVTMHRIASEAGTAVGAIYRYYPSKGALVAAMQTQAIERLGQSYRETRLRADALFAGEDPGDAALAGLVLVGRFLVAAADRFPAEIQLFQMLLSQGSSVMSIDDGLGVLPSAMALLNEAAMQLTTAQDVGVIEAAERPIDRVMVWIAGLGGVLKLSDLARYDATLFDGAARGLELQRSLVRGWGAHPDRLAAAEQLVERLAAAGSLVPVPGGSPLG